MMNLAQVLGNWNPQLSDLGRANLSLTSPSVPCGLILLLYQEKEKVYRIFMVRFFPQMLPCSMMYKFLGTIQHSGS